jgi:hypothetical protein
MSAADSGLRPDLVLEPYEYGGMDNNGEEDKQPPATVAAATAPFFTTPIFVPPRYVPIHSYVRITHILDMDGFLLSDGFLCKELALIEVSTARLHYEHFRLGRQRSRLNRKDQKIVDYVSRNIHGIPFVDGDDERLRQEDLRKSLLKLINQSCYEINDVVVGYKGGNLEKAVLDSMGIASFNLELIGCPKYDELVTCPQYQYVQNSSPPAADCPLHVITDQNKLHCAKQEVCVFRKWYLLYYLCL